MKKLNYLLVMLIMCALCGCSDSSETTLSVSSETLSFPYNGGTQTLTIAGDAKWGISKMPEWLSASVASGIGTNEVKFTAKANSGETDRSGFILVYRENDNQSIIVEVDQTGTHASPITVDSQEEKVFGGRASTYLEESLNITCDTEWEIEGPSWVNVIYNDEEFSLTGKTHHEGSGVLYLKANETYTGDDARRDTVYLRTLSGESDTKIPVCQLGKNDIHCIQPVTSPDGFLCRLKSGSNVEYIVMMIYAEGQQPNPITYSDFNDWYSSFGALNADGGGDGTYLATLFYASSTFGSEVFQRDTDYTIYMLGANSSGYYASLSNICQYTFHTLNDAEIRPKVEISNAAIVNGKLQWTVTPNEYTTMYWTMAYSKKALQGLGMTMIQQVALELAWAEKYGMRIGFYSDVEKTFSPDGQGDIDEADVLLIAMPYGAGYVPSSACIYDISNP